MNIWGLTGQSGSGKGTAAAIFARYGVPSVNTDEVYHEILAEKGRCTAELAAAFGADILDKDGFVSRPALAAAVFGRENTPQLLTRLNGITHKYIMAETLRRVNRMIAEGAPAVLIDAPQLFEAGAERVCDCVIGVLAPRAVRLARVMTRDNIGEDAAAKRLAAQHEDAFYRSRCDTVLENDGDLDALDAQIRGFLKARGFKI